MICWARPPLRYELGKAEKAWNGTSCDAWTVVVKRMGADAIDLECTLFEFANKNTGPDVETDVPCAGCAAGVMHKTWDKSDIVSAFFLAVFGLHILRVGYVRAPNAGVGF